MGRPKKTRLLKIEYQRVLCKVVDVRTWNMIKSRLEIEDDNDLTKVQLVRALATLRRRYPYANITKLDCQHYIWLSETINQLYCDGRQLYDALQRLKPRPPTLRTIYNWGHDINCPFSFDAKYTPSDLDKWLERVLISTFHY